MGKAGVAIDSMANRDIAPCATSPDSYSRITSLRGEVAHGGNILFDGIPLDKMSVSMTMNGAVCYVLRNSRDIVP